MNYFAGLVKKYKDFWHNVLMSWLEGFQPKSLLAFIVAFSLVAWFGSILIGNEELKGIASTVFIAFALIFVMFLLLTLIRNVRSL